jgi:UDP-N-acetylglucosamine 2-epimerase (non-hydrolysing)
MRLTIVAGARPNFIKIAPLIHAINEVNSLHPSFKFRLVHTGQHFDKRMSATFFEELEIPEPDTNLEVNGGSQAEQTAGIMIAFEKDLLANPTDLVIVVGDVTSTMACAIVAKKLQTKVAHIEAGIRSYDITMPEEINRMVTDSITDYFFTTTSRANQNLVSAGVKRENIYFVGNVMIDTLLVKLPSLKRPEIYKELDLKVGSFFVLTLHRPANVDESLNLEEYLDIINQNCGGLPVIFPVHPRTRKNLELLKANFDNIYFVQPLGYLEFIYLIKNAKGIITDSGGITEEATVLNIPCMTLRNNTERPETCELGTNELIGTNPVALIPALEKILSNKWKRGSVPPLWDGKAAIRIVNKLLTL